MQNVLTLNPVDKVSHIPLNTIYPNEELSMPPSTDQSHDASPFQLGHVTTKGTLTLNGTSELWER